MIITDLQYFGTISHIQSLMKEDQVFFDNFHPFTKMSFKNRMVVATAQGPLQLTIPIVGGRDQKTPLNEIMIAYDTPWHLQHYKTLVSNYQRAPYFEYYQAQIKILYESKPANLLSFLMDTHNWIKKQIKGKWEPSALAAFNQQNTDLKTFDPWLPNNYHRMINPIKYPQVFEDKTGFIPNLSILDLLFNCGGKVTHQLLEM